MNPLHAKRPSRAGVLAAVFALATFAPVLAAGHDAPPSQERPTKDAPTKDAPTKDAPTRELSQREPVSQGVGERVAPDTDSTAGRVGPRQGGCECELHGADAEGRWGLLGLAPAALLIRWRRKRAGRCPLR